MSAELRLLQRDDWTYGDLETMPDDGLRYEVADGHLLVTPPPRPRHQLLTGNLVRALHPRLELGQRALEGVGIRAPVGIMPREQYLIPDVAVVTSAVVPEDYYEPDQVFLVAEVVSPSSHLYDRTVKRDLYGAMGIASYLLVDPQEESLTAYRAAGRGVRDRAERGELELVEQVTARAPLTTLLPGLSYAGLVAGA